MVPKRLGRPVDELRRERLKGEILAVAARHFADRGFSGADLGAIAADLGLSKPTLYYYFHSKEGLFLAALDAEVGRLREAVMAAAGACSDPLEEVCSVIYSYLGFFDANPHVVELLIEERSCFKEREKPTYFIHQEETLPYWRGLLEQLIAAGRIRSVDIDALIEVASNSLYGTVFTNHFCRVKRRYEEQAAAILDLLFSGLLRKGETLSYRNRAVTGKGA